MSLKKETIKLSLFTVVSIICGMIFHILLARFFGVSRQLDCLFIVLSLFNLLAIFNAFLTSLFIPIFNELKKEGIELGLIFFDAVIKWAVLISLPVILVVLFFDRGLIKILAPGFDADSVILTVKLMRIVVGALLFFSVANTTTIVLNALYYYSFPALAALFDPILNILAMIYLTPVFGIKAIMFSVLVSNILRASFLLIYLKHKTGWRPSFIFFHPKLPELVKKSFHMGINGFIWSLRDVIVRNFASRLGEGMVALYAYAEKIMVILVQSAINPLNQVFYSRISEWVTLSRWDDLRHLLSRAVRVSVFLAVFICSLIIVFLQPLLKIFFLGSKFDFSAIDSLWKLVCVLLGYFLIISFEVYFSKIILSVKKINVITLNAIIGVVIIFVFLFLFYARLGIYVLPAGLFVGQVVVCLMYYFFAAKFIAFPLFYWFKGFSKYFFLGFIFCSGGLFIVRLNADNFVTMIIELIGELFIYLALLLFFCRQEIKIMVAK